MSEEFRSSKRIPYRLSTYVSRARLFSGRKPNERVTQSALNLLIHRLQGRVFDQRSKNRPDRPGEPGPKAAKKAKVRVDLFAYYGIWPWTLDDIRRTLGEFLDDKRLGGAAVGIAFYRWADFSWALVFFGLLGRWTERLPPERWLRSRFRGPF